MSDDRASQLLDKIDGIKTGKSVEDLAFFLRREENLKKVLLSAKPEIGAVETLKLNNGNTYSSKEMVRRIIDRASSDEKEKLEKVIKALDEE
jgi:hypothetical protein